MKHAKRFKEAIANKRPPIMNAILGQEVTVVQPPESLATSERPSFISKAQSESTHDRKLTEKALVAEGVHREVDADTNRPNPEHTGSNTGASSHSTSRQSTTNEIEEHDPSSPVSAKRDLNAAPEDHRSTRPVLISRPTDHIGKGHAHDPLSEHLYLALGTGESSRAPSPPTVSESPPAADSNIYESAYDKEIQRLRSIHGRSTTLFLTRRVEDKEKFQMDGDLVKGSGDPLSKAKSGLAKLFGQAKNPEGETEEHDGGSQPPKDTSTDSDATRLARIAFGR